MSDRHEATDTLNTDTSSTDTSSTHADDIDIVRRSTATIVGLLIALAVAVIGFTFWPSDDASDAASDAVAPTAPPSTEAPSSSTAVTVTTAALSEGAQPAAPFICQRTDLTLVYTTPDATPDELLELGTFMNGIEAVGTVGFFTPEESLTELQQQYVDQPDVLAGLPAVVPGSYRVLSGPAISPEVVAELEEMDGVLRVLDTATAPPIGCPT